MTKDATDFATKLVELKKSVPKQKEAYKHRRELVHARRELKSKIFTTRQAFATVMNKNLASTVVDYRVTIRFHEGTLAKELEELIKTHMGWRTSQVPKAQLIAENIPAFVLLDAIDKRNTIALEKIVDENKNRVFSKSDAQEILTKLKEWALTSHFNDVPSKIDRKSRSAGQLLNLTELSRIQFAISPGCLWGNSNPSCCRFFSSQKAQHHLSLISQRTISTASLSTRQLSGRCDLSKNIVR